MVSAEVRSSDCADAVLGNPPGKVASAAADAGVPGGTSLAALAMLISFARSAAYLMSEAIRDHQRHSKAIRDHQRHSNAIRDHQRHSKAIRDHQRHSKAIRDHQRRSKAIRDHQR
jgi:hypothetical protein